MESNICGPLLLGSGSLGATEVSSSIVGVGGGICGGGSTRAVAAEEETEDDAMDVSAASTLMAASALFERGLDAAPAPGTPPILLEGLRPSGASDDSAAPRPSPCGLVVGLGDPVSDILVRLDDAPFAARVFASGGIDEPGGCLPVNSDGEISKLLTLCRAGAGMGGGGGGDPKHCPGGSAANVTKGIANLGGEAAFVGMVGRDAVGRRYRELLAAQNVRRGLP
jgi:hypothetical protein